MEMLRILFAIAGLMTAAILSGCHSGPQCYDCAGCGPNGHIAGGPIDSMRQWRRSLTCGAGCGETYYGEWRSTPPDCVDPCPQFGCGAGATCGVGAMCGVCDDCGECCGVVGGCGIRPVRAAARIVKAVYGKRFCEQCGYDVDDCGCGDLGGYDSYGNDCGCASCSGGEGMTHGGPIYDTPAIGGGACPDGNCGLSHSASRTSSNQSARQPQTSRNRMATIGGTRPVPDPSTAPAPPQLFRPAQRSAAITPQGLRR